MSDETSAGRLPAKRDRPLDGYGEFAIIDIMEKQKLSDFDQLMADIEREAEEEGPAAVAELNALRLKYRMIGRLIGRRRELHLTQQQLAQRSGVGQAEISKIERGRSTPTLDTYSRLATALDFSPADLALELEVRRAS